MAPSINTVEESAGAAIFQRTYKCGERPPLGLANVKVVTDVGEDGAVLGVVDLVRVGAEDVHAVVVEGQGQVVGDLAPDRHNRPFTFLKEQNE